MNRILLAVLLGSAAPVAAQEHQHPPTEAPAEATPAVDPHAGHDMAPAPAADPHAGHDMAPAPAADPHAAHGTPAPVSEEPVIGNQPPPPIPRDHAADTYWGSAAMAPSREILRKENGVFTGSMLKFDRFERQMRKGVDGYHLAGEAWVGGDLSRMVIEVEGEMAADGPVEQLETQLQYSRAIAPYFNLRAGVRHDFRPRPQRTYAALGIQGLAPYWVEVEAMLFLSTRGDLSARIEGSVDQRLTQKLILQPRAEVNFAAQDDRAIGVGAGLSDFEIGARLRYEISPQFAPYVGVEWSRSIGRTARFARAAGEDAGTLSLLVGVRFWF